MPAALLQHHDGSSAWRLSVTLNYVYILISQVWFSSHTHRCAFYRPSPIGPLLTGRLRRIPLDYRELESHNLSILR